jgi:hypothetical protein
LLSVTTGVSFFTGRMALESCPVNKGWTVGPHRRRR